MSLMGFGKRWVIVFLYMMTVVASGQTIKNGSFENGFTNWENQGMKTQTNTVFNIKAGTTYAEKWTDKGGNVGDARLSQVVRNVPAGVYTLTVAAQNIQEDAPTASQTGAWIFADSERTKVDVRGQYTVRFVCVKGVVTVGFEAVAASGNWIAVDNFRLTKAEATLDELRAAFLQLITETEAYTQQPMDEAAMTALKGVIAQARAVYDANTEEGVDEACKQLVQAGREAEAAIYQYKKEHASVDDPLDMTDHLQNPSFEDNFTGWENQGMQLQGNTAFSKKQGSTYVEKWVSAGNKVGDALLQQKITGLEVGTYIVKCAGQNIQEGSTTKQKGAYLFGNASQTPVQAASEYSLTFSHIDGTMMLGFEAEGATGNWLAVDNFRLYYAGCDMAVLKEELLARIAAAQPVQEGKMRGDLRTALEKAIADAGSFDFDRVDVKTQLPLLADALTRAVADAEASMAAYGALQKAIDVAEKNYGTGAGTGADAFRAALDRAIGICNDLSSTNEVLYAQVGVLERATLCYKVENPTGAKPKVTTDTRTARGCRELFGRMSVTGVSSSNLLEQGFVYSETNPEPTVLDQRSTDYLEKNGRIYRMPMKAGTLYYIRAYAMTKGYAVGYGDVLRVSTLPQGDVTWSYDYASDDPAQNQRIETAVKEATEWWTNYTSITGFNLDAHWSPGTPTADCGYGGYMRIGTNMGQRCGTVMHEMNHGVGCGTLEIWGGWVDSPLRVSMNGDWAGDRANEALQFWENDNTLAVTGAYDGAHWGIHHVGQTYEDGGGATALWMNMYPNNGAHLEPGAWAGPTNWNDTQIKYIGNSIITQGFMEDGLVPVNAWSGGQCLPAYTFVHIDNQKYYLTNESNTGGCTSCYLTETANGVLKWLPNTDGVDEDGDGMNDAAAWYVTFDAQRQLYQLQNAQTGHYLSNTTGTTMKAVSKSKLGNTEQFTLMRRRAVNAGDDPHRGYWITNYTSRNALQANANGAVAGAAQDMWDRAAQQRWIIATAEEAIEMRVGDKQHASDLLAELVKNLRIIEQQPYTENVGDADSHSPFVEALLAAEACIKNGAEVDQLNEVYTTTRQAGVDYMSAVTPAQEPFDLTFLITNPTMKEDAKGWTDTPVHNFGCSEFYMTTFDCYQTLVSMPKGYLRATVQGFQRPGAANDVYTDLINGTSNINAYLYLGARTAKLAHIGTEAQGVRLGGAELPVGNPSRYVPDNMEAAGIYFDNGLYGNEVVLNQLTKNKDVKLGVRCNKVGEKYWTIFRNFHLYFFGKMNPTDADNVAIVEDGDARSISANAFANKVYDMSGRQVGASNLKRGIYIANGKKIIK